MNLYLEVRYDTPVTAFVRVGTLRFAHPTKPDRGEVNNHGASSLVLGFLRQPNLRKLQAPGAAMLNVRGSF